MVKMEIHAIRTGLLQTGDSLVESILHNNAVQHGDIIVVSSKAIATVEGTAIDLSKVQISDEAKQWAEKHERDPAFRQAVLNELERLHGRILDEDSKYMRSEVRPDGMEIGTILTAAAGLDESNVAAGYAIGWPHDPVASAIGIRDAIQERTQANVGIIVSDSCLLPRRMGVLAQALVVVGFDPIEKQIGKPDLHKKPLQVTNEARADQLTTAANYVMGNADQATPAAIIRGHGLPSSHFAGWVPGIDPKEDLFQLKQSRIFY